MPRLISAFLTYPWRLAAWFTREWNTFWFTPADPIGLGLIRLLTGLMLLYTNAVWGLALKDFLGPFGWVSPELAHSVHGGQYAYSFWHLVPDAWIWPVYILTMLVFLAFTLGIWTKITSIVTYLVLLSYVHRVPEALFGLDKLEVVLTFYLAIGDASALSIDDWLRRRRQPDRSWTPSIRANLGQRLIQVHMCLVYLFAGLCKLRGSTWWSGSAMWLALANHEYRTIDVTWLAWHPWPLNFLCHLTIAWELSFSVLIWNKMLRPLILFLSVIMHVGIGATLGLWTFSLIMMIGCASFLSNEGVRDVVESLAGWLSGLRARPRLASVAEPAGRDRRS